MYGPWPIRRRRPLPLLDGLIQNSVVPDDVKVELFANSITGVSDITSCREYLRRLNLGELGKLFNNGRPKIQDSNVNTRFLDYFKRSNWIKDYVPDSENPGFFKVTKEKQIVEPG